MSRIEKYIVYCDGACSGNPGPGGWGGLVFSPDGITTELFGSESATTNNQMELTASIECLKLIPASSEVILLTDSVYVLRGINEWIWGWLKRNWQTAEGQPVLNKDRWIELKKQKDRMQIEWRYVRGHNGTAGNERVDQIAVKARDRQYISPYVGPTERYLFSPTPLPPFEEIPKSYGSTEKKKAIGYLSMIGSAIEEHQTWQSCEARVKGRSGAKFKKFHSIEEAESIKKDWKK